MSLNTAVHKNRGMIISALTAVVVAVVIFSFSAQPAVESDEVSGMLTYRIVKSVMYFSNATEKELLSLAELLHTFIRKLAHFTIYACLSMPVCTFWGYIDIRRKTRYILSFGIPLLYAVSDEIHQYFVPGRYCSAIDVFIDFMGITAGIALICIIKKILRKFKKV